MSNHVTPVGEIRVVQDGDVFRVVDDAGRRYFWEIAAFWAEERHARDAAAWDKHTAFREREAVLLADVLRREQRALAMADELARGLCVFEDSCEAAKKWLSGRRDG